MLYTQLVNSQPLKTIQLPFNGLYNSFIGTALDSELESYAYDMVNDKAELVYNITYNIDNQKYNNAITKEYADYLNHAINEEYKTDITFLNVSYDKWNDVYIGILLEYISLNLANNYEESTSGIELEFLEMFNGNGGCIELAYNCLSNDDANKLSDLLAE